MYFLQSLKMLRVRFVFAFHRTKPSLRMPWTKQFETELAGKIGKSSDGRRRFPGYTGSLTVRPIMAWPTSKDEICKLIIPRILIEMMNLQFAFNGLAKIASNSIFFNNLISKAMTINSTYATLPIRVLFSKMHSLYSGHDSRLSHYLELSIGAC